MSKILDVALDITKATVDITQNTVQTSILLPIQAVNYSMSFLGVYNVFFEALKNSLLGYALHNPYEKPWRNKFGDSTRYVIILYGPFSENATRLF